MDTTAELTPAVLAAWASVGAVESVVTMPKVSNPLWRVDMVGGGRFVLKSLPEYSPGVTPVEEFRVLTHLQSCRVPVVLPVVTDAGSILATVDDRQYALLPYVDHDATNHELGPRAARTAHAVGAAIGHLDLALAGCPWPVHSFTDDPAGALDDALPGLPTEAAQPIAPLVDRLRNATTDLPTQLTHGDCNTGNLLLRDHQPAAFLDLDHLPTGPRIRDLAYYLVSRLRTHLSQSGSAERDAVALVAVLGDYVAGYDSASWITAAEAAGVVPIMLLVELGGAHWALHGWEVDQAGYGQSLRSIRWMTSRYDLLVDAASRGRG